MALMGPIGLIRLIRLIGRMEPVGLIRLIGLIRRMEPMGLIRPIGLIGRWSLWGCALPELLHFAGLFLKAPLFSSGKRCFSGAFHGFLWRRYVENRFSARPRFH